jgi:hypothetical protein
LYDESYQWGCDFLGHDMVLLVDDAKTSELYWQYHHFPISIVLGSEDK